MQSPTVSFVVPCYNMAHLLPDCIKSLLSQTYGDFEVLIMDDCSPDNTPEIAQSFSDPRIRHIRNDPNLGHLSNYNKGIGLSRGKYVWLISADDYLRSPYILQRYVDLMDSNPKVGYVFCPGLGVRNGVETDVLGRLSARRDFDQIIPGHTLLTKLLRSNFVLTPSGMVRRDCYERVSLFDLTMPWCGDWYLWCLFALHSDVGYLAEPMVCYRQQHAFSMTNKLIKEKIDACAAEEIRIPWMINKEAKELGYFEIAQKCLSEAAHTYARVVANERYRESSYFMNFALVEESLRQSTISEAERDMILTRVYASVGNECYWRGDEALARKYYRTALRRNPWMIDVHVKNLLLVFGKRADNLRRKLVSRR